MSTTGPPDISEWFKDNPWIYAIIGGVAVGLVALFFLVCCYCVYCYRNRGYTRVPSHVLEEGDGALVGKYGSTATTSEGGLTNTREPSVVEDMNRRRLQKETTEKSMAREGVEFFVRNHYSDIDLYALPDMGSRMQKYWFKVIPKEGETHLITIAPVSPRCPVKLDSSKEATINKLIRALQVHPYLHRIEGVYYIPERSQLVISQPFLDGGSLKDTIYKATPTSDWSQKYSRRSRGLSSDKVALYGHHILEAMLYLYSKGFPILGHVQSGNCFVKNNRCQLAGYENTLLGYKTRLYRVLKEHMDKIDIIMFGHLVFEMSCGYELTTLVPTESDYQYVKTGAVKEILQFIFEKGFPNDIEEILAKQFFQNAEQSPPLEFEDPTFSSDVKSLLKTVGKGKAVSKQPTKAKKGSKTPLMPPSSKKIQLEEEPVADSPSSPKKPTPTPRKKKPAQD